MNPFEHISIDFNKHKCSLCFKQSSELNITLTNDLIKEEFVVEYFNKNTDIEKWGSFNQEQMNDLNNLNSLIVFIRGIANTLTSSKVIDEQLYSAFHSLVNEARKGRPLHPNVSEVFHVFSQWIQSEISYRPTKEELKNASDEKRSMSNLFGIFLGNFLPIDNVYVELYQNFILFTVPGDFSKRHVIEKSVKSFIDQTPSILNQEIKDTLDSTVEVSPSSGSKLNVLLTFVSHIHFRCLLDIVQAFIKRTTIGFKVDADHPDAVKALTDFDIGQYQGMLRQMTLSRSFYARPFYIPPFLSLIEVDDFPVIRPDKRVLVNQSDLLEYVQKQISKMESKELLKFQTSLSHIVNNEVAKRLVK